MSRKAALPFIIAILAIPVLMLVIKHKPSITYFPRVNTGKARIRFEPIIAENTEEWEIVTDPQTGIPLKVIGHRKVSYG